MTTHLNQQYFASLTTFSFKTLKKFNYIHILKKLNIIEYYLLLMVWSNTLVSTANRWRWHSGSGGKGSARRSQQAEMFGRIGCSQACQVVSGSHYISTPPYP